jgi:Cu(I)/Ag(I) efflux system membrane fusion protein
MHPSVHAPDPGKCPICGMDLVPVLKQSAQPRTADVAAIHEFHVPVERQQQIGVSFAEAKRRPLHHVIRSVGMVVPDKTRHWEFVARVDGYVQKLYVTSPGEPVEKDQPLLTIYSPDLLVAEHEFVTLLETRDRAGSAEARATAEVRIEGGRRRLEQWNITPAQIAVLEKTRKPSEELTLYSPFKGVVESVPVDQGRRVQTGDHLVDVADLSIVWVWAEFYENELPMLAPGQKITLTSRSYPGELFEGAVALVDPFVNELRRTARVRIDLPNTGAKLRPGMYLAIDLPMDMGVGLTIPVGAVMPTGSRTLVFVDKGAGNLEPRFIQIGEKYGDDYEVLDGLKEGERVVTSANFLIDAEAKVQGAIRAFAAPEAGHVHAEAKP